MDNINYSLIEYFQNKYPIKYDKHGDCIDEEVLYKNFIFKEKNLLSII